MSVVALHPTAHRQLRIDASIAAEQGADTHMFPVVLSEFAQLVVQYPILFSKNSDTGQFVCVTLMGLEQGENLFWQQGEFDALYLPLNIERQPFTVGIDEQQDNAAVICVDTHHPSVAESGEPLFTEDGQPSALLQDKQQALGQLIQGEQATQAFLDKLLALDLLVPLKLDITFENQDSAQINGMYSIDEEKLNALSAEQLAELQKAGYLQPIYTQLASVAQVYRLIDLKNRRNREVSPWFKASGE